jgi:alcohol dehydrogenase (cytochrome c)
MTIRKLLLICVLTIAPVLVGARSGRTGSVGALKPLANTWPTYSGDYTGRRFSTLKQADKNTVKNLTWAGPSKLLRLHPPHARQI